MNESAFLVGLDVGGTAVKVGLFDESGKLRGLHQAGITVQSPRPGWAEMDPMLWRQAITEGVRHVIEQGGISASQVRAVGLSNMIGTLVPLDGDGLPLRPAIAYYDLRSTAEARWMMERAPQIPQVTGNRVLPGNTSLTSALWITRHEQGVAAKTAVWATTNTLLFRWLTGEWRVDWTNASFVGLLDYMTGAWSPSIADALSFDITKLAPLGPSHSTAPLLGSVAESLGLPPAIPVSIGGVDGAMSSVGVGAIEAGAAFDVSGTSEMIGVCLPRPVSSPELLGRWHVVPELWTLIGAMSTSGAALQWFRDRFYRVSAKDDSQVLYDAMTAEAAASPPGANGVVFLPHMMGERAPIWDPYARGVFFGLTLSTARGDMTRAIMEGTAYAMRHLIELIEGYGGLALRRVIAIGGAARNRFWRQLKADVWNVELFAPLVHESTVLGAALTAGVGAGLYADYAEAVYRAVPREGESVFPDPDRHAAYETSYRVYRRLYPALASTMHDAAG